jgi:hypothetical protein
MPYGRNITYLSPVAAVKMESKEDDYGDKEEDSGTEGDKNRKKKFRK